MGRIPDEVIEEVLRRTDIVQTVQQYVTLKRAGANMKGLCPFHNEKTPSFNVHPTKGIYKCFGCGAGGNVIGFLMDIEGWNFPETVRHLAERNGIEIPEETSEESEEAQRRREGKKLYFQIMSLAQKFFEDNLWSADGKAAQLYLSERGIDEDTARTFAMGYAPQGWSNLLDHLARNGIQGRVAERAGLVIPRREKDGFYDRFRHRIIFPVRDIWGNTLAFGGRVFAGDDDGPKYINSPETTFYTKGQQLYGLYESKKSIQQRGEALIVEGNFDVIALHAQGVDVAIAPMGTALTGDQARMLSRYCRKVVVAFDGDSAGEAATLRCFPALQKHEIEASIVRFAETEDPDTFVRSNGRKALEDLMARAPHMMDWAIDKITKPAAGGSIERKLEALKEAGELVRTVENPVAWEHYAQEVSRRLDIEPSLMKEYIQRPKSVSDQVRQAVVDANQPLELGNAEFGILAVLLDHPEWLAGFLTEEFDKLLSSAELSDFLNRCADYYRNHEEQIDAPVLLQQIEQPAFRKTVEKALVSTQELYVSDKASLFYQDCVRGLKRSWAERTLVEIQHELDDTDFVSQRDEYQTLIQRKMQVERFKQSLDARAS